MWSFEKLFGESVSSGDERISLDAKEKGECVSGKWTKYAEVSQRRNLHTLKNL